MEFIFGKITFIIVLFLSVIFIALYFYFTRNFKFWHKLGIPYDKPTPFVGNLKDCVLQKLCIGEKLQRIYEENNDKPYVGIFSFDKPSLVVRDLELVKKILVKDSEYFINHALTFDEKADPIFCKILFVLKDQLWRHLRTKLTPVFTSGKMKKMFYLVDTCGKDLAECLDRGTVGETTVDVTDIMYRYTTDVIASCAFGINGYSLQDPQAEFGHHVRKMTTFSFRKGLAALTGFFAPRLQSLLKLNFIDDDTNLYIRRTVWSTVKYREKHGIERNDFLDCMMDLRKRGEDHNEESNQSAENDVSFKIDGDLFVAQAAVFIVGGYETSGSTLYFALYELAMHPEIQHRLRNEMMQVMNKHNGQLTYDSIQEMSYLDMVVSETLRIYPILPFLDRICSKDYELPAPSGNGTVTLPAGTAVYIPLLGLHNDPEYYPEPEKFDPDRFTEENKRTRTKYSYMPFGEGPRTCIGMRFALMEMKSALCHILSRFEVAPCKDTPVRIVFDPKAHSLSMKGTLPLRFKPALQ